MDESFRSPGTSRPRALLLDRWQALQAQLAVVTATAAAAWTRRSPVTCRWRALPADVSAWSRPA